MKTNNSKIWLITDTHFNHAKLIEYGRPVDFEEQLKGNLKRMVKPGDTLIHLGDVCIGQDVQSNAWFKQELQCRTWLTMGNHDGNSVAWYLSHGWDFAGLRIDLAIYGKRFAFSHYPQAWDGYFDLNVHGHFHDNDHRRSEKQFTDILTGYNRLLAVERTNYEPVLLENL